VTARRKAPGSASVGVQNGTALADNAVKCSAETPMSMVITAEILAFSRGDSEITAKTAAHPGCLFAVNNSKLVFLLSTVSNLTQLSAKR
jgi:hypothetical protein